MDLRQAEQVLMALYNTRLTVELQSGPGLGKTSLCHQIAAKLAKHYGEPFGMHVQHLTTLESIDARGYSLPGKDKDGQLVMQFTRSPLLPGMGTFVYHPDGKVGQIFSVSEVPKRGIVLLDERGQADMDIQKPVARFQDERRIGDQKLDDGWVVWSTSNRTTDRSGVGRTMAFQQNRMCLLTIEPSLDAWVHWAEHNGIHPFFVAFAKFKPGEIFKDEIPDKEGPFCTPRTFVRAGMVYEQFRAIPELMAEPIMGLIGEGACAALLAFIKNAEQVPTYEAIIKDPRGAKVPERPDACFAVTQMVASRVEGKHAEQVVQYLARLPEECQVIGLQTGLKRAPELLNNKTFAEWVEKNSKLVLAAHAIR